MQERLSPKAADIRQMFGRIAPRYDLLNRLMTGGLDVSWRKSTVRELDLPSNSACFLDLATGTGDLAVTLARHVHDTNPSLRLRIEAVDFSLQMLELGHAKLQKMGLANDIHLHCCPIEHLPFPDSTFDGATIGFGIRNVIDRKAALQEILRVLKPGAKLAILEAVPPEKGWQRCLQKMHMVATVQLLGGLFSERSAYRYLGNSVQQFPTVDVFKNLVLSAGFRNCHFRPLTFGAAGLFTCLK